MKKNTKKFNSPQIPKKPQSSPNIMTAEQEKMSLIQQFSLKSLSGLIKNHQAKFFSKSFLTNDTDYIIETLNLFKNSLSNSLFIQTEERNQILKNVK